MRSKLGEVQEAPSPLHGAAAGSGGAPTVEAVLALASDQVAEALDGERGAAVQDPSIYRAHAARYEVGLVDKWLKHGTGLCVWRLWAAAHVCGSPLAALACSHLFYHPALAPALPAVARPHCPAT